MDPAQDLVEQHPWHRYPGQLEHDVAPMVHDPGADLHRASRARSSATNAIKIYNLTRKPKVGLFHVTCWSSRGVDPRSVADAEPVRGKPARLIRRQCWERAFESNAVDRRCEPECELRTRFSGLSLAKYWAAPPGIHFGREGPVFSMC